MAGYIFSISKDSWSTFCANELSKGYFTPYTVEVDEDSMVSRKRKANNKVMLATFGDLVTMKPGDNIYFLSDRKIYGVGKTINVGEDCLCTFARLSDFPQGLFDNSFNSCKMGMSIRAGNLFF